ncbi:tyrosine--tRNA ligase [Rhizobium rhizogenes]|uniref:tyrosine--tRNA ligase n=1 Tax=Rhizobium rhizogenes TaxID=359 RepID=UPI001573E28A|nr:tyrosine--tRNA ligase [Rhizobium rhizogenes]NTH23013.1 tyrosine--tRNA ligase [Rhizobium rhizogenes]NTH36043.1 tyrosine--tRNA ligase [Rhizobium rhizogenes]
MNALNKSVQQVTDLIAHSDLEGDIVVRKLLEITTTRRSLDLSDLSAEDQADLMLRRSQELQPSAESLAERIRTAKQKSRPFIAKFGIDPTGAEVHLGHAVPMIILSRFQRMGHRVVFIVGDITAKIGDPTGRSNERPPLSDEDIAQNLSTYREQVTPFFDFDRAEFRYNGDWLREIKLPRLIEITAQIPMSMPLQRDDFRKRLNSGQGLTLSEVLYSVVMALDSVEINCDIEIGGIDQFLNMQMCRKVMDICGQIPELVLATPLIEGTDGTGAKMSKSKGNYVPLTAAPGEIFGKVMSIPDHLMQPYFEALTEWQDVELDIINKRLSNGSLRPVDLKKILAGEVTAAIHGLEAAMSARDEFAAKFSRRTYGEIENLPYIADIEQSVLDVIKVLQFAKSNSDVRRLAEQQGVKILFVLDEQQEHVSISPAEIWNSIGDIVRRNVNATVRGMQVYLKVGRKLARVDFSSIKFDAD